MRSRWPSDKVSASVTEGSKPEDPPCIGHVRLQRPGENKIAWCNVRASGKVFPKELLSETLYQITGNCGRLPSSVPTQHSLLTIPTVADKFQRWMISSEAKK
ncbi:hypothetical protein AVEN_56452-1 [Araneus ventricosus]|uniref:Uncharacterized protein n=1 Tax=Araneus ventricosus TaxID=182803 RepID=A0A4Y2LLS2_ARAVE|nr:hypothetical protein AVEN_56452-1 [Araneus ventricosus]